MNAETILALAEAQGFSITPARAREIAAAIGATLATVNRIPVPFEAEPAAFLSALEALAQP
jgi:uncharacterized protein (DUF697 family)